MTLDNDRKEEAVGGASKLHQVDGLLGLAAASTAITLALTEPSTWLHRYAYFAALSGTFFAGVTLMTASVWATDSRWRRHASGRKLALAVPLIIVIALFGISVASSLLQ